MQILLALGALAAFVVSAAANDQALRYKQEGKYLPMYVTSLFVPAGAITVGLCIVGILYVSR